VKTKLRRGIGAFIIWQITVGIVLVAIFPYRPKHWMGWVLLIFFALPFVLSLEYVGTAMLYHPRLVGRSRATRLVILLAAIVMLGTGLVTIWQRVKPGLDIR
jgi:hypothetical protein